MAVTQLSISRNVLRRAGELAEKCSSGVVRERVLVSQAVALSFRQYVHERFDSEQVTSDGRSGLLKYVDLLDICDFKVRGWQVDVRSITTAEREALYVPTVPLMVGVLSDFYVCAQVDSTITAADIMMLDGEIVIVGARPVELSETTACDGQDCNERLCLRSLRSDLPRRRAVWGTAQVSGGHR
jgi:hypothetical protein